MLNDGSHNQSSHTTYKAHSWLNLVTSNIYKGHHAYKFAKRPAFNYKCNLNWSGDCPRTTYYKLLNHEP